jgi:hypothetical protein
MHVGICLVMTRGGEDQMPAQAILLEQAQRCWRLARSVYNQQTAAELEAYARQLEERARFLERKKPKTRVSTE